MKLQSSWRMGLFEMIAGKYSFCKVSYLSQNMFSHRVRQQITSPACSPKVRWMVLEGHSSSWIQLSTNCRHEMQGVTGAVTLNVCAISAENRELRALINQIRHCSCSIYFLCRYDRATAPSVSPGKVFKLLKFLSHLQISL